MKCIKVYLIILLQFLVVPCFAQNVTKCVHLCSGWGCCLRIATRAEFQELIYNCTWEWTTQSGVNGYRVTSKINGESIFLPAAGYRSGTGLYSDGTVGYYWSSSKFGDEEAQCLRCKSGFVPHTTLWYSYRYLGHSVRPVCE